MAAVLEEGVVPVVCGDFWAEEGLPVWSSSPSSCSPSLLNRTLMKSGSKSFSSSDASPSLPPGFFFAFLTSSFPSGWESYCLTPFS